MQDAKPGSHTVWDCKYHIVWITKYRFPVLGGDVGQRARELLREIARAHEMTIYAGSINRDHVHMLIGIPPQLSVSRAVQYLKGKSSHKLLSEYQSLRKRYFGANIFGSGDIGSLPAATSLTRHGRSTLRIRSRRFRMIISTWYSESALVAD
jgi:putative transposase